MHPYSRFDKQRKKKKRLELPSVTQTSCMISWNYFSPRKKERKNGVFSEMHPSMEKLPSLFHPPQKISLRCTGGFPFGSLLQGGLVSKGEEKGKKQKEIHVQRCFTRGEKLYLRPCSSKIICWILVDSPPLHSIEYKCEIDIERNYRKKNNIKKGIISIFFEHNFVNIGKKEKFLRSNTI